MRSPVEYLKKRIAIRGLDWGEALKKGEQLLRAGRAAEALRKLGRHPEWLQPFEKMLR